MTLIELMIVLAIVAIMGAMATGAVRNQLPALRANAASRDLMSAFQQARARAIRTGRPQKLCIYSLDTAFSSQGGYQVVSCKPGRACNDPLTTGLDYEVCSATAASGIVAANVSSSGTANWSFPQGITPASGSPLQNIFHRFDNGGTVVNEGGGDGFPNTAVTQFFKSDGTLVVTPEVVEVAFTSLGTIDPRITTQIPVGLANVANSGGILIENTSTSSAVRHVRSIRWTPSGGVRIK